MRLLLLAAFSIVAFSGCDTTPKPPQQASSSNPAGLVPVDEYERAVLTIEDNGKAMANHALHLSNLANAETDNGKARDLRKRSVEFAQGAIARGSDHPLLPMLLAETRPDGSRVEKLFSKNPRANRLLQEGEVKFSRGDMEGALACYTEALEADPTSAHAALFAGDVYFSKHEFADALPWFGRAIAINPLFETPYRYRADALMRLRRYDEAGADYIDAFISAPFTPLPTKALNSWIADRRLKLQPPDSSFIVGGLQPDNDKFALGLHPDHINWISLAYVAARAKYTEDHGIAVKGYRQSLAEELDAIRAVITIAGEIGQNDPTDEHYTTHKAALDRLKQIDQAGLLEAHILLDRLNQDLAQDYGPYLSEHRQRLRTYLREYWLGMTPQNSGE